MSMNFSFNAGSSGSYGSINKNNAQYKAAAKDYLANHRAEVARMSPLERQMYELFGGEQAYMRNVMKMYSNRGFQGNAEGGGDVK